jgi:hypothetical protein
LPAPTGPDDDALLLDAWREALAEALDLERTQWQRHRELVEAQNAATILQLRAEAAELRSTLTQQVEAIAAKLKDGADGAPGPPGEKGDAGPAGEKGENGDATLLPPELAEQVASAARLLHELPPIASERSGRMPSGRVLRIERDEHGALVPIYDELQP